MGVDERYELRVKELNNRIYDLKEQLNLAKENAFSTHESYVDLGKSDAALYDAACKERDAIKEELVQVESELNNLTARIYEHEFIRHENENSDSGIHSKNLMNIAFIFLGLAFALLVKQLFF